MELLLLLLAQLAVLQVARQALDFFLGFLGVAFGAFGAHALRARLSPEMLAVFETGVRYQMYHAFALLIVAVLTGLMVAGMLWRACQ